jgi:hypothetical protein
MALEEREREDLLRDGRNMPVRGECVIDATQVVIGFRSRGQLSLFCGADPVFQFNVDRHLRRVFFQGRRFAAENGRLVELIRPSRGGKIEFDIEQLEHSMQQLILASLEHWLEKVHDAVEDDATHWRIIGDDAAALRENLRRWLQLVSSPPKIADAAGV